MRCPGSPTERRIPPLQRRIANASLGRGDPAAFSLAAWIHYNLAVIHPFTVSAYTSSPCARCDQCMVAQDGNGRVVRIVSSLPLLKAGFPPINIRHAVKEEYLAALHIVSQRSSRHNVYSDRLARLLQPLTSVLWHSSLPARCRKLSNISVASHLRRLRIPSGGSTWMTGKRALRSDVCVPILYLSLLFGSDESYQ